MVVQGSGKRKNPMKVIDLPSSSRREASLGLRRIFRRWLERARARWGHRELQHCQEWGIQTLPEEAGLQEEWHRKVQAALSQLPEKYGKVVGLFYLEGWKCADIARTLNLSLPQVEARLLRGRSLLKASLQR